MRESEITLGDICTTDILSAGLQDSLLNIMQRMRRARVSSMVIVEQNSPVGIITEKDLIRLVTDDSSRLKVARAEEVMSSPLATAPASEPYQKSYARMQQKGYRHIVAVNDDGSFLGIATETDFVQHLGIEYLTDIKHVDSVMDRVLMFISADATLLQAFKLMEEKRISYILIGSADCVEGILSERDIIRLLDDQVELDTALAQDYMSSPVFSISPDASLVAARQKMQKQKIRRLLVSDSDGKAVGLLTRKSLTDQLQNQYIELMREAIDKLQSQLNHSRSKEIHYRGFFENSPLAYQSLDENGLLLEVNASWRGMMGYDNQEIIATPFRDLLVPGQEDKFLGCFNRFKQQGEVTDVYYRLLTKTGDELDVQFTGQIVYDDQGKFARTHCLLTNLTQKKQVDSQLQLFRQLIDSSNDALFVIDEKTARLLDVNKAACNYLEYSREELLKKSVFDFSVHTNSLEKWRELTLDMKEKLHGRLYEVDHISRTGKRIPVEISSTIQKAHDRMVVVSTVRDISDRKEFEEQKRKESNFSQAVIDCIGDPVMVIDTNGKIIKANKAARNFYLASQHPAQDTFQMTSVTDNMPYKVEGISSPLEQVLKTRESSITVYEHVNPLGDRRTLELMASPLYDEMGQITGIVESSRDITDHIKIQNTLKEKERSLEHLAHHDPLTKLPNRLLFTDRLTQALVSAKRKQKVIALLFIDIDEFKEINDSFGHNLGDELLKEVSNRLKGNVRECDTIARLGGDEFTVICEDLEHTEDAVNISQHLLAAFHTPIHIEQQRLHITLSIGISLYPNDAEHAQALIRNADTAMYRAKAAGKNRFEFYTQDMTDQAFERVVMVSALRAAIEQDDFVLHYQPQVDLRSGKVIGAEALIRWNDEQLGLIEPDHFIPIAEKNGLIQQIDLWVLNKVCASIQHWKQQGITPPRIAVNISARHFGSYSLTEELKTILKRHNATGDQLELEVTERVILSNPQRATSEMHQLRELGIQLSIDDFGTGYSSLGYLKTLPLNRLKIDRSFISDIPEDSNDQAISRAIIAMSKSLGLEVIAEGMETEAQRSFLLEEGCNFAQGFLYSHALTEQDFLAFLQAQRP